MRITEPVYLPGLPFPPGKLEDGRLYHAFKGQHVVMCRIDSEFAGKGKDRHLVRRMVSYACPALGIAVIEPGQGQLDERMTEPKFRTWLKAE
jgi:hypothetical protein